MLYNGTVLTQTSPAVATAVGVSAPRNVVEQSRDVVAAMDVVEVVLYQSRLSSRGPAYTRLAVSSLA